MKQTNPVNLECVVDLVGKLNEKGQWFSITDLGTCDWLLVDKIVKIFLRHFDFFLVLRVHRGIYRDFIGEAKMHCENSLDFRMPNHESLLSRRSPLFDHQSLHRKGHSAFSISR